MTQRFPVLISEFRDMPKKHGNWTKFGVRTSNGGATVLKQLVMEHLTGRQTVLFYLVAERDDDIEPAVP